MRPSASTRLVMAGWLAIVAADGCGGKLAEDAPAGGNSTGGIGQAGAPAQTGGQPTAVGGVATFGGASTGGTPATFGGAPTGGTPATFGGASTGGTPATFGGAGPTGGTLATGGMAGCPIGQVACGGVCADLLNDANNCGACGLSCSAGLVCERGVCTCPPTLVPCGSSCVNVQTDPVNCGCCGCVCRAELGLACSLGACDCPHGQFMCSPGCVDQATNPNHCGACGRVCATGVCSGGVCLDCAPGFLAEPINVLVLGDANVTSADTRGALWVGGNLTGSVGYDVGGDLPPDCDRYDLAVGGNIDLSGWLVLHGGSAVYGGTLSLAGVDGALCGVYSAASAPKPMPDFARLANEAKSYGAYLAALPATGTVSGSTLDGGAASCKMVVFDTDLCSLAGVTLIIPADGTAIVNSTCPNPTFVDGQTTIVMGGMTQRQCNGQSGTAGACERVLYNFPNATSVTVSGMSVQGSILAPYAEFLGTGGNVQGHVVVGSMDTGIEFHVWFFEGCLDPSTC